MAAIKRRYGKSDANLQEIVDYLRKRGCWVAICPPDFGFDLLVGAVLGHTTQFGALLAIEVKDSGKPISAQRLTEAEERVRHELTSRGINYYVVSSAEVMRLLLGTLARNRQPDA